MTPSHFNTYQSSYNNPQFQQQFSPSSSLPYGSIHPTQHYSTTYSSTPLAITYPSAPYPNAYSSIVHHDALPKTKEEKGYKVLLVEAQGSGKVLNEEELSFLVDLRVAEGPVTQSVITHNATYQADDLVAFDSDCDEISTAQAVLMANLSSYGSDVLSEVPHSENTHNDMLNQSVQEMMYSEQTHLVNQTEN
ncbi:hypothetical protein Tco_1512479 [Tanacetum coccineum]